MLFDNTAESIGYTCYNATNNSEETFYFGKNVFGDIVTVYSDDGDALVTYTYDAWGCVTAKAHGTSAAQIIGALVALMFTPITYRGYNYDINTGLYYLQSRYYNPAYGRFLNADSIIKTGDIHGANIFAYCNNNPVMSVDYSGLSASESFDKVAFTNIIFSVIALVCLQEELQKLNLGYVLRDCVLTDVLIVTDNILTFFITLQRTNIEGITEKYQVYYSIGTVFQWLLYLKFLQSHFVPDIGDMLSGVGSAVLGLFLSPEVGFILGVLGVVLPFAGNLNTIEYIDFLENSMDMSNPYTTYFVLDYIFVTTSSYGRTYSLLDEPILKKVG